MDINSNVQKKHELPLKSNNLRIKPKFYKYINIYK